MEAIPQQAAAVALINIRRSDSQQRCFTNGQLVKCMHDAGPSAA